jgi:hypothetical protein
MWYPGGRIVLAKTASGWTAYDVDTLKTLATMSAPRMRREIEENGWTVVRYEESEPTQVMWVRESAEEE